MSEGNFPLIVWEATEKFKEEYKKAEERFYELYKKLDDRGFCCTYMGSLKFDAHGYPEIWINDNRTIYNSAWTVEEAIAEALEHGDTGWWSFDELEDFVKGKGPIFEEAMWDIGFRRHKKNPEKWARRNPKDRYDINEYGNPRPVNWDLKHKKQYMKLNNGDSERLEQLIVLSNHSAGLNRTYSIEVGKRGFIYISLQVNPFSATTTEQLPMLGRLFRDRGHIAKEQDKFKIEAGNIKLGKEDMVYIKAVKPDKSYVESVWPSQIPNERIHDLARDLVSRIRGEEVPKLQNNNPPA